MPFYHFDASAVVKRYVDEVGSAWVRRIADDTQSNVIGVADDRLVQAAVTEGLAVENPNHHLP